MRGPIVANTKDKMRYIGLSCEKETQNLHQLENGRVAL